MISISDVAHMYKLSCKNGHPETRDALLGLMMLGLGERQKQAFTLINANGPLCCLDVANKLHISRRNTSVLLSKLRRYGLVDYKSVTDKKGSHYEWYGVLEVWEDV